MHIFPPPIRARRSAHSPRSRQKSGCTKSGLFVQPGFVDPIEHEALYVVDGAFSVRTYLVFGLEGRHVGRTDGPAVALVGYDGSADAAYLRGWMAGGRAVRGACGPDDGAIVRALRWLDPDRGTVVWLTGGSRGDAAGEPTR